MYIYSKINVILKITIKNPVNFSKKTFCKFTEFTDFLVNFKYLNNTFIKFETCRAKWHKYNKFLIILMPLCFAGLHITVLSIRFII